MAYGNVSVVEALTYKVLNRFNTDFITQEQNMPLWDSFLAFEDTVTERAARYPWFAPNVTVDFNKVGDPLTFRELSANYIEYEIQKRSGAVRILKNDVLSSTWQADLMRQVNQLVAKLRQTRHREILATLRNGDVASAQFPAVYDGQPLFSTAHTVGLAGTTWGNLFYNAFSDTALNDVLNNFRRIPFVPPDDAASTNPYRMPFLDTTGANFYVIISPKKWREVSLVLHNQWLFPSQLTGISGGTTVSSNNTEFAGFPPGSIKIIADASLYPDTADEEDWYVAMILPGEAGRPFLVLKQSVPGSDSLIPLTDAWMQSVYDRDEYRWVIEKYEVVKPAQYFLLAASKPS